MPPKHPTSKKKKTPAAKTYGWSSGTAPGTWVNSVGISADGKKVVAGTYFYQKEHHETHWYLRVGPPRKSAVE